MRAELYADSKDAWKWSIAIRKAKESQQVIYWVVMLRPDLGEHGDDEREVLEFIPSVASFFKDERRLHEKGRPPSLARTTLICEKEGVELFSFFEQYPSGETGRLRYMKNVSRAVAARTDGTNILVLLDPDDGIGERKSNGKQIYKSHLSLVWDSLRQGDSLGIVQFQNHVTEDGERNSWPRVLQKGIAGCLGVQAANVVPNHWDKVCVYLIDR